MGRARNRKKKLTLTERVGPRIRQASSSGAAYDSAEIGVAHHEAAHAVVDSLLGLPLEYVEIAVGDTGVAGFTSVPHPQWVHDWPASGGAAALDNAQRAYLHANMMASLAGALADCQFRPYGLTPDDDEHPHSDVGQVYRCLWALDGGVDEGCVQRAMNSLLAETNALLGKHWPQVQAVVAALVQRRRLTGSEVKMLLDRQARAVFVAAQPRSDCVQ
jgi:hypothetical protein